MTLNRSEFGLFADYIWRFVDGRPRQNNWANLAEIPAQTAESAAMSRRLL
jgi:DNA-3-methyladenine glycosylase I